MSFKDINRNEENEIINIIEELNKEMKEMRKWREDWNKRLGILEERVLTIERVEQREENKNVRAHVRKLKYTN